MDQQTGQGPYPRPTTLQQAADQCDFYASTLHGWTGTKLGLTDGAPLFQGVTRLGEAIRQIAPVGDTQAGKSAAPLAGVSTTSSGSSTG